MRLLLHLRADGPDAGPGGLGRFVQDLLVRSWRSDLPGGGDAVYSFSNIFPPAEPRPGDTRRLLIASPNPEVVRALARQLRRAPPVLRARGMRFRLERHETFSVRLDAPGLRLVTATPVLLRVPAPDGPGTVYWAPPLEAGSFLGGLNRDLVRRYNRYHATRLDEDLVVIASGTLLRALRSRGTSSSYWELEAGRLTASARRVLAFGVDAGLGERTRQGFGFVNIARPPRGVDPGAPG